MAKKRWVKGEFDDKFATLSSFDGGHNSFKYKADACFRRHKISRAQMEQTPEEVRAKTGEASNRWYYSEHQIQVDWSRLMKMGIFPRTDETIEEYLLRNQQHLQEEAEL